MSLSLTLFGVQPDEVMKDVYFRQDFIELHARPDSVDTLEFPGFHHSSAVRTIPERDAEDMETPWGYGGPVAACPAVFWEGIGRWRQRQADRGRVAEFIRLHPFLNPLALRGWLDQVRFDRLTVLVDLTEPADVRRERYTKGTRYSLRQAKRHLVIREAGPAQADVVKACYDAGLARNRANDEYYFCESYFRDLLEAPWSRAWIAEHHGHPIAAACFLFGGPFAHYHLSGGPETARPVFAQYLLLEHAIEHFAAEGRQWMHLGGGRTAAPDDPLLKFKTRFSPWRTAFYTGGIVFDPEAYQRLSNGRSDRFLSYRFDPRPRHGDDEVMLRQARREDFAAFFRLKCDVDNVVWSGHTVPPDWRNLSHWYFNHLEGHTGRRIYVGEAGGRCVGYTYVDDCGEFLEVTIGVATADAGRGMGRSLLKQLTTRLREEGEKRPVQAWIFLDNKASIKAFEAAGFVRENNVPPRFFDMTLLGGTQEQRRWVWRCNGA